MFIHKAKPSFIYILPIVFIFFFLFGCNRKQTIHQTDLDNLYAYKRTQIQKDSIANKYSKAGYEILQSDQSKKKNKQIDSLISKLRWSSNTELFFKLVKTAEQQAKEQYDISRLAHLYENMAVYYHDEQQLDSVYTYYLKAEHLYKESKDSIALAENIYYQARLLYEVDLYQESESKLDFALNILKKDPKNPINIEANQLKTFYKKETDKDIIQGLIVLEQIYYQLKKDKGIYTILPKEKFNLAFANLCLNIALNYIDLGQLSKAKDFCLEGLDNAKNIKANQIQAHLNWSYHKILYQQGLQKNIVNDLIDSYNTYIELNHPFYAISLSTYIAELYREQNQTYQSLNWLLKAYELADKNKFYKQKKEVIQQLLEAHPTYETQELIAELVNTSYFMEEQQNKIVKSFTKIEFDTFILEQENSILKQRVILLYFIITSVIISFIFIFIVVRLRIKNRELIYANDKQQKNEQILNLILEKENIENQTILKERNRIARDLHDGVVNSIFTLRFNTQLLQIPNEELKNSLIKELIHLEHVIRNISHSFAYHDVLQNKSFEKLLNELVNKQNNENKTDYSFECNINLEYLTNHQKINIYLIIQECFQNVNKHANASKCKLHVAFENNYIIFSIKDNGLGMKYNSNHGIGLKNIKERADNISAKLKIESESNKGTTLLLSILAESI
ncbi:histidine kinase [Myroides albus]|nr:ATP-binding protein [Myroides albus]UVD79859.1 histidine kinase [Myroides albus]